MERKEAGLKAFGEGILEVAATEKGEKIVPLNFNDVRKVIPKLADEFRTDIEAIKDAPKQAKRGITEALTKDLQEKFSHAKGIIDAWLIIKESEIAGLLGITLSTQANSSFDEFYAEARENFQLGSLHDKEVKKVLPNLENIFRTVQSDIEKNISTMGVPEIKKFTQEKAAFLMSELEKATTILAAWFAMLAEEASLLPEAVPPSRATGSVIVNEQAVSKYAQAAELLREQTRVPGTTPLERRGTAPLMEGEFDIDSGKVTLQNLIATLSAAVQGGPKQGREFFFNAQTQYQTFKNAVKIYFELRKAVTDRYRGEHAVRASQELREYGSELQHLVGGVKSLMVMSSNLQTDIGKANFSKIEELIKPIKEELDELWAQIGYSVGATSSVWKGSRQFLTHPKKGI